LGTLQGTTTGSPTGLPQVILASSGSNMIGVIDENKTTQFIASVVGETVLTTGIAGGATANVINLNNSNIVVGTFSTGTANCLLISAANGTCSGTTAGTVNYSYVIPGKAGDDTTLASGKCTLWLQEGEYATDVYEVGMGSATAGIALSGTPVQDYTVGNHLLCSTNGKLCNTWTTPTIAYAADTSGCTIVGYVTKTPSAGNPFLHFYLKNTTYRM